LLILALVLVSQVGCSLPQESSKIVFISSGVVNPASHGVSVVSIEVQQDVADVSKEFGRFGEQIGDDQLQNSLLMEGIQLRKVDVVDVPAIVAAIGEVIDETSVWHGQILKWRDIHHREIKPQGMLISEKGVPYFIKGGYLSLLCRNWLMEREDGIHMYVQCKPTWHIPRDQSSIISSNSMPTRSKIFSDLSFEVLLQDDEALVILVELIAPKISSGPQAEGPPTARLGEVLFGAPVIQDSVQFLVIEANILPRG